jgi:hypothetical protein
MLPKKPTTNGQPQTIPTFRDLAGREWRIGNLTVGFINRVLDETSVDLIPDNLDVSNLTRLLCDHRKLTQVLWSCLKSAAAEEGVSRESFEDTLDGEVLTMGWNALVESVLFFTRSQNPAMATAIEEAIEITMNITGRGVQQWMETMRSTETADRIIETALEEAGRNLHNGLAKALAGSATN